jgi:hypothetical protein
MGHYQISYYTHENTTKAQKSSAEKKQSKNQKQQPNQQPNQRQKDLK